MIVKVIDLFCGMGGFSQGSKQSGAEVILAVDSWDKALQVHEQNHPKCKHLKWELGSKSPKETWKDILQEIGLHRDHLHIHGSPPCQNFSGANPHRNHENGMHLVEWFLELIRVSRCDSWSMEESSSKRIGQLLNENKIPWKLLNFQDYGVSQTRKRYIAGIGFNFEDFTRSHPKTLRQVFSQSKRNLGTLDIVVVSPAAFKKNVRKNIRELDEISPTVCASRSGHILDSKTLKRIDYISFRENLILQTFPISYKMGSLSKTDKQKLIGNAVPPKIAENIMKSILHRARKK